jgi:hypothetical protein
MICRRSARQCIARLIRLRSTLHPPSGSEDFASRILRRGGFITVKICWTKIVILSPNLFILPGLHFGEAVLFIFLRQDESLDSPCLARVRRKPVR